MPSNSIGKKKKKEVVKLGNCINAPFHDSGRRFEGNLQVESFKPVVENVFNLRSLKWKAQQPATYS